MHLLISAPPVVSVLILSYSSPVMLLVPSYLLMKTLTPWLNLLLAHLPVLGKANGHISSRCSHLHGFALKCFSPFLSMLVCLFQVQFRYYLHEIHTDFIFLMFATLEVNLCYSTYCYLTNVIESYYVFMAVLNV